jgi:hypothetical protein
MTTRNQLANQVKQKLNLPQSDDAIISQLKQMGFSDEYEQSYRRLIASVSGKPKTGKTHFSLTAPPPIFFINIDIGTEGVVSKFQDDGKKIYIYDLRVPKTASKDIYVPMWENLKKVFEKVYSLGEGTVVVDTDTECYELARLAKFGKLSQIMPQHYTEVNNEYREVLRLAYDAKRMNSVFIHKMKPKYVNNARTSEYEPSGFGDMNYNSQINLISYRDDSSGSPEFSVFVEDCRTNPKVNGEYIRGEMCNFEFLLSLVHDK